MVRETKHRTNSRRGLKEGNNLCFDGCRSAFHYTLSLHNEPETDGHRHTQTRKQGMFIT